MKRLRYWGEFQSREGHDYRIEILQESDTALAAEKVALASEEPLTIEWSQEDKIAPICSSSATLTLASPTDRKFIDLYCVQYGDVRLDIYRNNALYWSGTLDTELYEEPYCYSRDYDATFTFSDFAPLDRVKYSGTGCRSVQTVIEECLNTAQIAFSGIIRHISTSGAMCGYTETVSDILSLLVNSDNFYDDDGEAMTLKDVLSAVLQPFALTIKQQGGDIHLFDINTLASMQGEMVQWMSDDATLGVDKVYNNVTLTYSPAAESKILQGEIEEDDTLSSTSGRLFKCDLSPDNIDGFRVHSGSTLLKSRMTLAGGATYMQTVPIYSGQKKAAVLWGYRYGDHSIDDYPNLVYLTGNTPRGAFSGNDSTSACTSVMIMALPPKMLNYTSIDRDNYTLRISMSLLFDVRYNPFEQAAEYNEEDNWEKLQNWVNFAYVPIRLLLKDGGGNVLYHYENRQMLNCDSYAGRSTRCRWVQGAGAWGDAFLAYYDYDDRKSKSGCGGWQENKPIIGYYRDELPQMWRKREAGDYLELPPVGGYLELQIGSGVHQFDYQRETKDIYSKIRWVAYGDPEVILCDKYGFETEENDIEDKAFINEAAREDMSVDTILGTPPGRFGFPTAKGMFLSPSFAALSQCTRAGVADRLERLLIGTIYSNYASRKAVLSGTIAITGGFGPLRDNNTDGKFLVLSEVQDLLADESEVTMAEIAADDYQGIDYIEED